MGGMAWRFSDEKEGVFKKKRGSPLEVFQKERVGGGGNGLRGFPLLEGKFFLLSTVGGRMHLLRLHPSIRQFQYFHTFYFWEYLVHLKKKKKLGTVYLPATCGPHSSREECFKSKFLLLYTFSPLLVGTSKGNTFIGIPFT